MRKHKVIIKWSYPVLLDNIFEKETVMETGIYYISRKRENSDHIVYIGKTNDSFYNRLKSHSQTWISERRGPFYVRLGTIVSPQNYDNDLLEDIESAIIMHMKPQENVRKVGEYTYRTKYLVEIHNEGYRGELPECIDAKEQLDEDSL